MSGVRMYRPMMARLDGASSGLGFSTMSDTTKIPSSSGAPAMMPYLSTSSCGTCSIATTLQRYFR